MTQYYIIGSIVLLGWGVIGFYFMKKKFYDKRKENIDKIFKRDK